MVGYGPGRLFLNQVVFQLRRVLFLDTMVHNIELDHILRLLMVSLLKNMILLGPTIK